MAGYPIQGYNFIGKLKVHSGLILVRFGFASFQILTKIGFSRGISQFVYPLYRNFIGFIVVALLACFSEKKVNAHLTRCLLIQFFFLALLGITLNQSLYLLGLVLTDPTFASALQNSIPTIVFMMATTLGFEQVKWGRRDGQAKLAGALLGAGGAVVMATYKGPAILHNHVTTITPALDIERPFLRLVSSQTFNVLGFQVPKWQLGALALLGNCASFAIWTVLQTPILRKYPARLTMVAFVDLFGTIQLGSFALWQEPKLSRWKISDGYNLFIILYAGLIGSAMAFTLQTWCVEQAGPVVTAAYQPLQTVMVGLLAIPVLGDDLHMGSVAGAMLIISGLYMITWGQAEEKRVSESHFEENGGIEEGNCKIQVAQDCSFKEPLLPGVSHPFDEMPDR